MEQAPPNNEYLISSYKSTINNNINNNPNESSRGLDQKYITHIYAYVIRITMFRRFRLSQQGRIG